MRLLAIALLASLSSCSWRRIVPDTVTVGVVSGSTDGSTTLNRSGFGDLLGAGPPLRADADFDSEAYVLLFGWNLGPSPRSRSRALERMEDRLVRMEALLRDRAEPCAGSHGTTGYETDPIPDLEERPMTPQPPTAPPYIYVPTVGADVTVTLDGDGQEGSPSYVRHRARVTEVHNPDVINLVVTGGPRGQPLPEGFKAPELSSVQRARYGVGNPSWRPVIRTGIQNNLPRKDEETWEAERKAELAAKGAAIAAAKSN